MKNFEYKKNTLTQLDDILIKKPEYKKMLNNLLGIGNYDNAVFTSSKSSNFDLSSLLSTNDLKKIFNNKKFNVEIKESKEDFIIKSLKKTNNFSDFINLTEENGIFVSAINQNLLKENFENGKQEIISELQKRKNKKIVKWKQIKNKYLDKQSLTNSWPLYIGTMFIKVKTPKTPLYAPLLLKKVEIQISDTNRVFIKALDTFVDINEKLLFLLQDNYKFNTPKIADEVELTIFELINEYTMALKTIVTPKFNFNGKFQFLKKMDVKNQELQYCEGTLLMIISPSGGKLRDKLIDIISFPENIEKILDIDTTTNFKSKVDKNIKDKKGVYRITPCDLSQERAIIGSLKGSTIIWGPPGTGKSQVIVNIIANLLANKKSTLITSEKKAALDVIKERLGKLTKFVFFGLVDKKVNKKEFYKPFKDLIAKIRDVNLDDYHQNKYPQQFIPDDYIDFVKQNQYFYDENIKDLISAFKIWNKPFYQFLSNKKLIKIHKIILKNLEFAKKVANGASLNQTLINFNIKKIGLIFKRYPREIRIFKKFILKIDNNNFLKSLCNIKNINNLIDFHKKLKIEKSYSKLKIKFKNDEDYLENLLSYKFKEKITTLKESYHFNKKVKSFLKNCESGFRIPYKFINIHHEIISELFYIFVSTPQSLANSIKMNKKYDYSIFDEASQLHLEKAVPFLHLADKNIIAGDNQQMRPTSYFVIRDKTQINEDSEENVESLLDYASRKGLQPSREFMLTKNYRSKSSELMMFSSKEFYENKLDVIDQYGFNNNKSIEVIDVNGEWNSRINDKEASKSLQYVLKNKNSYFKIILLTFNSTQKQYIEAMIYQYEKYKDIINMLENGNLKLRNLENIQGDEAELVIISIAYDKTASLHSTYVAKYEGRYALNVAISRAKEKIIILKSILSSEVIIKRKSESILTFRRWLEFLEKSKSKHYQEFGEQKLITNQKLKNFDSSFEKEVFDYLNNKLILNQKIFLKTQYPIGSYKIDLALIDFKTRKFILGIEVDGYKYHSGYEKMNSDLERQMIIEAKGYPIYRITELNWNLNKDQEVKKIKKHIILQLKELKLKP